MSARQPATRPSTTAAELRRFESERAEDVTAERHLLWWELLIVACIVILLIAGQAVAA